MVKKVFKILGIVLVSVLGFVGAVFGVMAAMGKFKTPVVYPTVLGFEVPEQMIVERIPYNHETDYSEFEEKDLPTLYSFVLKGSNPDKDHAVNKTKCYLWFGDVASSILITLCDENRVPLIPDSSNYYLVDCNEDIYYMVNVVEDDAEIDGKVTLMARSTNDTLQTPQEPMVIWIDRVAGNVFVKDRGNVDAERKTQDITVGVDIGFDFKYVAGVGSDKINEEDVLALKPVSKESAKEVELYYNVEGMDYGTDYIRVTKEEVDNPLSPLHSILTYDDAGVFTFKAGSANPKTHTFYLAVFATYEDKHKYEEIVASSTMTNYDKLTKVNDSDPVSMVVTTLVITVENIEISEVGFTGTGVVLDLYAEDNFITLNTNTDHITEENAKAYPLGLYMKKILNDDQVEDFTRFDEVSMESLNSDVWSDNLASFVSIGGETWNYEGVNSLNGVTVEMSNVVVDVVYYTDSSYSEVSEEKTDYYEEFKVVNSISYTEGGSLLKFYCSNGAAVIGVRNVTNSYSGIKLLKSGSYLNFYVQVKDGEGITIKNRYIDFDFEAKAEGSGKEKTWQIITKEIPFLQENESLRLGILLVNSSGMFSISNYFDTVPVTMSPIDLDYEILNNDLDFDITFTENETKYPEIPFSELVSLSESASYKACVLVAEEKDKYIVETVKNGGEEIKFTVGEAPNQKTYVLVGYVNTDAVTGRKTFVNAVKVCDFFEETPDARVFFEGGKELSLLQFKNDYKETAQDIIDGILNGEREIESAEVLNVYTNQEDLINVSAEYILNEDLLSIEYFHTEINPDPNVWFVKGDKINPNADGYVRIYEDSYLYVSVKTENETMLEKVIKQSIYDFTANYDDKVEIDEFGFRLGGVDFVYRVEDCLSTPNTPVLISLVCRGGTIELGGVVIVSTSPSQIVFSLGDGNYVPLSESVAAANESNHYIEVEVSYNSDEEKFSYSYKLNQLPIPYNVEEIFNSEISEHNNILFPLGFQDETYKGKTLEVSYTSSDPSIFSIRYRMEGDDKVWDNVSVSNTGEATLSVQIGSTTQYIRIETIASEKFDLITKDDMTSFNIKTATEQSPALLSSYVTLSYETSTLDLTKANHVYVTNVRPLEFGDGELEINGNKNDGWTLTKDNEGVLTISDSGSGWGFVKTQSYIPLSIYVDVETIAGTKKDILFIFESDLSLSVNNVWTNNRVFYAGTTVLMQETTIDPGTNENVYNLNAVIKEVWNVTPDDTISYTIVNIDNNEHQEMDGDNEIEIEDRLIGDVIIVATLGGYGTGNEIQRFKGFKVLPNVVASAIENIELKSEENYELHDIYSLRSYKDKIYYTDDTYTTVSGIQTAFYKPYGSDENSLYTETNLTGTPTGLSVLPNQHGNSNPILSWEYKINNVSTGESVTGLYEKSAGSYFTTADSVALEGKTYYSYYPAKLTVGSMTEIRDITRKIQLVYSYTLNSEPKTVIVELNDGTTELEVKVSNKNDAKIKNNLCKNNVITLKALKEYNISSIVEIDSGFTLTKVEIDNILVDVIVSEYEYNELTWDDDRANLFELVDSEYQKISPDATYDSNKTYYKYDKFRIISIIDEVYKDVVLRFTFTNGSQELIFETAWQDEYSVYSYVDEPTWNNDRENLFELVDSEYQKISSDEEYDQDKDYYEYTLVQFVLEPYTPYDNNIEEMFSETEYDLLNNIYDIEDNEAFDVRNIKKLIILSVLDENGEEVTSPFTPTGFIDGNANAGCTVTFSKIIGENKTIFVKYEITYEDDTTFVYDLKFTLNNRQTITTKYPENGVKFNSGTFKLLDSTYSKEVEKEFGVTSYNETTLILENYNVEPLLIYADKTTKINFVYEDNIKKIKRAEVTTEGANNQDVLIKLVGYETLPKMAAYAEKINESTNSITLSKASEIGLRGGLLFRLETESGDYAYYIVYVFCNGSSDGTNIANNLDVVAYNDHNYYEDDDNYICIEMEESLVVGSETYNTTTYYGLVDSIPDVDFKDKFKRTYDYTSLYLYNGSVTGEDLEFDYNSKQWKKLTETDVIQQNAYFNKIIIGLVYDEGAIKYCYGTITIYVQPNINITTDDTIDINDKIPLSPKDQKPNGEFTANVDANAEQIICQFKDPIECPSDDYSWVAKIISVVDSDGKTKTGVAVEDNDNLTIKLINRVDKDTTIRVEYSYTTTYVYVDYLFAKTSIPQEENEEIQIGEFVNEEEGFNNSIDLSSTDEFKEGKTFKEYFFGTYEVVDFSIKVDDAELTDGGTVNNVKRNSSTLKFKQLTENKTKTIEIIYSNFKDENGAPYSRTFTFNVEPGIYIDDTSTSVTSGLHNDKRVKTTATTDYGSINGSTLELKYFEDGDYFTHKIAGLTIYTTEASYLNLSFDSGDFDEDNPHAYNYVVDPKDVNDQNDDDVLTSEDYINDSIVYDDDQSYKINFVHTVNPKDITISIKILDSTQFVKKENIKTGDLVYNLFFYDEASGTYIQITDENKTAEDGVDYFVNKVYNKTRNLYVTVVQTYTDVIATYKTAGADHENVASGSTISNLRETLFTNDVRYQLYDINGNLQEKTDVDFDNIGFTKEENPNYIKFEVVDNANGDLSDNSITFDENNTGKNFFCELKISNNAGLTSENKTDIRYKYQVMAGDYVDGLDYSVINDHKNVHKDKYYTFTQEIVEEGESVTGLYDEDHQLITDANAEAVSGKTYYTRTETEYISYILEGIKADSEYSNENKPFVIGKMLDEQNKGIFNCSEGDGYYIDSDGTVPTGKTRVGEFTNAKQYHFIKAGHNIYVTCEFNTGLITLIVIKASGTAITNIELTITADGVNGDGSAGTLINNLVIYLSKDDVESTTDDQRESIYANDIIKLIGNAADNKFVVTGSVSLELIGGSYTIDDNTYYVDGAENELYEYDSTNNEITFNSVSREVYAEINFLVKSGKYIIKEISYRVAIHRNLQFIVNNETLKKDADLETRFVLDATQDQYGDTSSFPILIKFRKEQSDDISANFEDPYYNVLAFDLYHLKKQGNPDITQSGLWVGSGGVKVTLITAIDSSILEVTNDGIMFHQDFTGEIEIELSQITSVGRTEAEKTYAEIWKISVSGVTTLTYVKEDDYEQGRIDNNTYPFNSGTSVKIVNNQSSDESGVVMTLPTEFKTNATKTLHYDYKIITLNETTQSLTNQQLFEIDEVSSVYKGGKVNQEESENAGSFSIILPNVPSTPRSPLQAYFVTYKLYVDYLGLSNNNAQKIFYITYIVQNIQQVDVYLMNGTTEYSGSVNVDERIDNEIDPAKYYLDLFYFKETFGNYELIYSDGEVVLKDKNDLTKEFTYSDIGTVREFTDGQDTIIYDRSTNKLTENGTEKTGRTTTKSNPDTYTSVFNSDFANIFAFKNFIETYEGYRAISVNAGENAKGYYTKSGNTYTKITNDINAVAGTTYYIKTGNGVCLGDTEELYTLVEIKKGSGRYGIDLKEHTDVNDVLFNNEKRMKLALVDNGVETITLNSYTAANERGFRLYAPSKITAKTNNGEGIALSQMFLASYVDPTGSDITMNTTVIGVGTPDLTWVSGASSINGTSDALATISIPSGNSNNTYYIYQVTYSGGAATYPDLYSISESFYYIGFGTGASYPQVLAVPNYMIGTDSTFFNIDASIINDDDKVEFDLTTSVMVWTMQKDTDDNKYYLISSGDENYDEGTSGTVKYNTLSESDDLVLTLSGNKIVVNANSLLEYKIKNPTKTTYGTINVTLNVVFGGESVKLAFRIKYSLPTLNKTYTLGSSSDIEIGTLTNITSVTAKDSTFTDFIKFDASTKNFSIDGLKLETYFTTNGGATDLSVDCIAEDLSGYEFEFTIVVNKKTT